MKTEPPKWVVEAAHTNPLADAFVRVWGQYIATGLDPMEVFANALVQRNDELTAELIAARVYAQPPAVVKT